MKKIISFILAVVLMLGFDTTTAFASYYDYNTYTTVIENSDVRLSRTQFTYSSFECTPKVTVTCDGDTLEEDYDYKVTLYNNVNVGTATVKVEGIGYYYSGTVKKTFKIVPKTVKAIHLGTYHYNGKAKTPAIYVNNKVPYDKYGETYTYTARVPKKYYTIKYSGSRKNVGKCKVTVKFKGPYRGTAKGVLPIRPPKPTKGRYKAISKSQVAIRWTKGKQTDGFEIQRYNYNTHKYSFLKRQSGSKLTVAPPKGNKIVDVKIRSYKTVKGKKLYSDWVYKTARPNNLTKAKITSVSYNYNNYWYVNMKDTDWYEYQVSTSPNFYSLTDSGTVYYSSYYKQWMCPRMYAHYIRVRRYFRMENGNYKYGPWSDTYVVYH